MDREPVIKGMADSGRVHIDWLLEGQNRRFFVAVSRSDRQERVTIDGSGGWRGIFTGQMVSLPGTIEIGSRSSEIFVESES